MKSRPAGKPVVRSPRVPALSESGWWFRTSRNLLTFLEAKERTVPEVLEFGKGKKDLTIQCLCYLEFTSSITWDETNGRWRART